MVEQTFYRLALLLPQTRELLAIKRREGVELPRIGIPCWSRPAAQLTRLIAENWKIKTIVLDVIATDSMSSPMAILEVLTVDWCFDQEGLCAFETAHLDLVSLDSNERRCLTAILGGD